MSKLVIIKPDDWHLHLRDDPYLQNTVPASAQNFARALVMPNLNPPLTTLDSLNLYKQRIIKHIPKNYNFIPYMTVYLNETVDPNIFKSTNEELLGAKLYPAGVTTNSEEGAKAIQNLYPLFDEMQNCDKVLQIHGEVLEADIFDREKIFLTTVLSPIIKNFPKLRIVLEHISTKTAVNFVLSHNIVATITPHHLIYNRNDLFYKGIRPHLYCLPIVKRQEDQIALQKAATSGNKKFFAGTDSAPHAVHTKESACGCAGIFNAPYAIQIYAEVFEKMDKLKNLEGFLSLFGAEFYGLAPNKEQLSLIKKSFQVPATLKFGNHDTIIPIEANNILAWTIDEIC